MVPEVFDLLAASKRDPPAALKAATNCLRPAAFTTERTLLLSGGSRAIEVEAPIRVKATNTIKTVRERGILFKWCQF